MNTQKRYLNLRWVLGVGYLVLITTVFIAPRLIWRTATADPALQQQLTATTDANSVTRARTVVDRFLGSEHSSYKQLVQTQAVLNTLPMSGSKELIWAQTDRMHKEVRAWSDNITPERQNLAHVLNSGGFMFGTDVQRASGLENGALGEIDFGRLGGVLWILFKLALPFTVGGYIWSLARHQISIKLEAQFGFINFVGSAMLGPLGIALLPGPDHRKSIMRDWIHYQLMLRQHLRGMNYHQTAQLLDALVDLNLGVEQMQEVLDRRFGRLREEDFGLLAQFGAYATVMLVTTLSSMPHAHAAPPSPMEIHGFVQMNAGSEKPAPQLERVFVNLAAQPESHVSTFVQGNLSAQKLLDAQVKVEVTPTTDTTLAIRAGNLVSPMALLVPPPHKEVLIGGPEVERLVQFFAPGVEGIGRWKSITSRLGIIGGNDRPGAQGSLVWNQENLRIGMAAHNFADKTGRHTRGIGELFLGTTRVFTNAHLAGEWLGSDLTWITSVLLGVRPHDTLQLAVGVDEVRVAHKSADHIVRAQATLLPLGGTLYIGLMERWSALMGSSTTLRLQGSF